MSLNKLMLIGHVGKDPDIRILEAGSKVATFSFATTENRLFFPVRSIAQSNFASPNRRLASLL